MLFYNDKTIHVDRNQARHHIYYDHDYQDKLRSARIIDLIEENEIRSAWWLSDHLSELSFVPE